MDNLKKMGIYIDLSNVEWTSADLNVKGMAIDYSLLVKEMSDGYELVVLNAYDGKLDSGATPLQNSLRSAGFDVILYEPQMKIDLTGKKTMQQKEVDTAITTDVSWDLATKKIDTAIIVSGDRDMHPAVKRALDEGCDVRVVALKDSLSDDYLKSLEKYTLMEDYEVFTLGDTQDLVQNFASFNVAKGVAADE